MSHPDKATQLHSLLSPGFIGRKREHGCDFVINDARTAIDAVSPSGKRWEIVSVREFEDGSYKSKFSPRMTAVANAIAEES